MKKILYLSDIDISVPGGAQESMKTLMEELSPYYEFYLIAPKGKKINNRHIVLCEYNNFILRGKRIREMIGMLKDISQEIKSINPDIIHLQMPSTLIIVNFLFTIGCIDKKTKVVYTDRGIYGKYGRLTTKSINSIVKKADKIITTTKVNRNNYEVGYKKYKKYRNKFKVIYNTGGKEFDIYKEDRRRLIRENYNIKEGEFVVGFCGRYSEQKNWALAYEIINSCNKRIENLQFILVLGTDGTLENYNDAVRYLKRLKEEIGADKIKAFINISNNQVADLYYAMDCFVLTSKWESFGRTAVEAMSRKNIVISTDVDGLSEVIGEKEFTFSTSEQATQLIDNYSQDAEKVLSLKEAFYTRYHKKFGYKQNVNMYKKVYEEILDETKSD